MEPSIGAYMRMDYEDAIDEMLLVVDGSAKICGLLQDHPSDTALEVVRVALRKVADDTIAARQKYPHPHEADGV